MSSRPSRRNEVYLGDISVPDVDDMLARTLRAMIPALALAAPSSRLAALPDGLEFRAELGLDSTDVQNIASAAQKAFDITITGGELAACVTLGRLSRLIHNKVASEEEALAFNLSFKLSDT